MAPQISAHKLISSEFHRVPLHDMRNIGSHNSGQRRFMPGLLALAVSLAPMGTSAPAASEIAVGQQIFADMCSTCHGANGEEKALGRSARLNTLDAAAVRAALKKRQQMASPETMQDRIKAALSDDEVESLALYVATLSAKPQ